jgi:hypothetical protein
LHAQTLAAALLSTRTDSAIWFPTGTMEKGSTAITGKVENA